MLSVLCVVMIEVLVDVCLVWELCDVVGGDFYYFELYFGGWFVVVVDCIGYGVLGVFLILIVLLLLKQVLELYGLYDLVCFMCEVNCSMKCVLGQYGQFGKFFELDDGMDVCFFWFDSVICIFISSSVKMLLFLLVVDGIEVLIIEGKCVGLGYVDMFDDMQWDNYSQYLVLGVMIFVCIDGVIDQIGGFKYIVFGKQCLCCILLEYGSLVMLVLGCVVMDIYGYYQGMQWWCDDICFFGVCLDVVQLGF